MEHEPREQQPELNPAAKWVLFALGITLPDTTNGLERPISSSEAMVEVPTESSLE